MYSIPIQNIYYLLAYAWDCIPESEIVDVSGTEFKQAADLMAHVLIGGTNHLLRRGLDRGYREKEEETSNLRGRIDLNSSVRRLLLPQARANCRFDDFDHDVLHNRILKTTIHRLSKVENLDQRLRSQLKQIRRCLPDISEIPLNRFVFRKVQLHRNNAFYAFIMNVCELIDNLILPEARAGRYQFRDFLRDENSMPAIFESFIFNFYRKEQVQYRVSRDIIEWDASAVDESYITWLPQMRTDVTLRSAQRTIVIEVKYKKESFQEYYGKETFHSANLYQLFAYLKNLEKRGGPDSTAIGILIYPTVSKTFVCDYKIHGHAFKICTIDLAQDWRAISRDLLFIVGLEPKDEAIRADLLRVSNGLG